MCECVHGRQYRRKRIEENKRNKVKSMREAREEGAKQVKESAEKTQWCECVGV